MKHIRMTFVILLGIIFMHNSCSSSDKELLSSENSILAFSLEGIKATIDEEDGTISVTLPVGTEVKALKPSVVVSDRATISPSVTTEQNFSEMVPYSVKAENGLTKQYRVYVTVEKNTVAQILTFALKLSDDVEIEGVFAKEDDKNNITVVVPFGTDITNLLTNVIFEGGLVTPSLDKPVDFSRPVIYTVIAEDEVNKTEYEVTVIEEKSSDATIEQFVISDGGLTEPLVCEIVEVENGLSKISAVVPFGIDLTKILPQVIFKGYKISPEVGKTIDFTNNVTYTITAQDGTEKKYQVSISMIKSSDKELEEFSFIQQGFDNPIIGQLNKNTNIVTLDVPYGANVTGLKPTIKFKGHTISPAQDSYQDFSKQVFYTISAQDASEYRFSTMVAYNPFETKVTRVEKTSYFLGDIVKIEGKFDKNYINSEVYLRDGTARHTLEVITGSDTYLEAKIPQNGFSGDAYNFTLSVVSNGSTAQYQESKIKVYMKSSESDIEKFVFKVGTSTEAIDCYIDGYADKITAEVPMNSFLKNIAPTITVSKNATVQPTSGERVDLSKDVIYTVTAQDGTVRKYTVSISVAKNTIKQLDEFSFDNGFNPIIDGIIDEASKTVSLEVPYGTNITNIIPSIKFRGASIDPAVSSSQDFTKNVVYTITAEDGETKEYTVKVKVLPFDTKISGVNKLINMEGDELMIYGKFASEISKSKASLKNGSGKVVDLTLTDGGSTSLKAKIPATGSAGKGFTLSVTSNETTVNYTTHQIDILNIEEVRPNFISISPHQVELGLVPDVVTITGINFVDRYNMRGTLYRRASDVPGAPLYEAIINAAGTEIKFTPLAREGIQSYYFVSNDRDFQTANDIVFEVIANPYPRPIVDYRLPNVPIEGQPVTLKGSNFTDLTGEGATIEMYSMTEDGIISHPAFASIRGTIVDDSTIEFLPAYSQVTEGRANLKLIVNGQSQPHTLNILISKK